MTAMIGEPKKTAAALWTVTETADYLRVSIRTLYKWLRSGELASYRVGGKLLIDPAAVQVFLEQSTRQARAGR